MKLLKSIYNAIIRARMTKARYDIAIFIKNEYPTNATVEQIQDLFKRGYDYDEVVKQLV